MDVEMFKRCTKMWGEASLEVKRSNSIPAKDPQQCVVRIQKQKGGKDLKGLQASRTRATLVVKAGGSVKVVSGRRGAR